MIESGTVSRADICNRSPGNGSIDVIGRSMRRVFVEGHEDDIKVRCGASRGKEIAEPIPSKRDASVMAIIIDVRLPPERLGQRGRSKLDKVSYRIPSERRQSLLGNISTKLGTIDNLCTACWVLLNILVANEGIVFPA
jgi:hypothetical protein